MNDTIRDLERDIEETRARLDHTIVRIQDRLSVSGVVDDFLGTARRNQSFSQAYDAGLDAIRRNPVPVMLIALGVGLLVTRLAQGSGRARPLPRDRSLVATGRPLPAEDIPVMRTGTSRVYDPDVSSRHPMHDTLESRRDLSARA